MAKQERTNKLFVKCHRMLTEREGERRSPMQVPMRLCRCEASCWVPEHPPPTSPVTHSDRQMRQRAHTHSLNYKCPTVKVCATCSTIRKLSAELMLPVVLRKDGKSCPH